MPNSVQAASVANFASRPDPVVTAGTRLIILYKLVKGGLEAAGAAVLAAGPSLGLDEVLLRAALALHHHATRAWAVHLSQSLPALVTPNHLRLAARPLVGTLARGRCQRRTAAVRSRVPRAPPAPRTPDPVARERAYRGLPCVARARRVPAQLIGMAPSFDHFGDLRPDLARATS